MHAPAARSKPYPPSKPRKLQNADRGAALKSGAPSSPVTVAPVVQARPPESLLRGLAIHAFEIIHGFRPVQQLSAWVTLEVAERLILLRKLYTESDCVNGHKQRIVPQIGTVHSSLPRFGVCEAAVTVHLLSRTRAVALRLEHSRERWRVTQLAIL